MAGYDVENTRRFNTHTLAMVLGLTAQQKFVFSFCLTLVKKLSLQEYVL